MNKFGRVVLVAVLAALLPVLLFCLNSAAAQITVSQPDPVDYLVAVGDDLWTIGARLGVSSYDIAVSNHLELSQPLQVGQHLVLPAPISSHIVLEGESLWSIAKQNGISVSALIQANQVTNPDQLNVGQRLYLPDQPINRSKVSLLHTGFAFQWPIMGEITSTYGQRRNDFHTGIDIAADKGKPIAAAAAGTVVFTGWSNGYGQAVKIVHGDGYETLYAHTSKILVSTGQQVGKGQIIADVGSTGNSTGPHLHFEVRLNGKAENPLYYLPSSTLASNY
ncbi:MAG: M23 family metallopeptidase [Peptococcaceae bacterium]|nr:M23 family metallopeptidase [Peptococcaceae bacterium]